MERKRMKKEPTKRELTIPKLEALAESTTHLAEAEAAKAMAEKMKPVRIEVQVLPVSDALPQGQTTFGFYIIVDGDRMIMTDGDGKPVRRQNGELYEHVLEPDQDPRPIAVRFTREIRKAALGEAIPGFYRRLSYSSGWIV
jgi:hypothetical protein